MRSDQAAFRIAGRRLWDVIVRWLLALATSIRSFVLHQCGTYAGSVAFSWLLSMFPLLILGSAVSAYLGHPGDAAALASRLIGYAPPVVQDALQPVIDQVLAQRNRALLALGLFVTVWTASSGTQAVRTALNRAYGVKHGLSVWRARIKVTAMTIAIGAVALVTFGSVMFMPQLLQALDQSAPDGESLVWMHLVVRYGAALVVVALLYSVLYSWLPDKSQGLREVLPGALLGALLWVIAVATLTATLRTAGKLLLVYGSFAGIVATLVFLYANAATLIFGAEYNAALAQLKRDTR